MQGTVSLVLILSYFIASSVQDNASNWFDNVGQVQQSVFQSIPDQAQAVVSEANDKTQKDLEAKEAECLELAQKVTSLQDKINELNSHTSVLQEKITELESSLNLKNQQNQKLSENDVKIETLEKQVENLQTSLTESQQLLERNINSAMNLKRINKHIY